MLHYVGSWALGRDNVHTWDRMTHKFLENSQDYCKNKKRKEEVFRMMQHEDESLEEYVERFNYNLQRARQGDLAPKTRRVLFLRGI